MSDHRPAWARLYAMVPATGLLCGVAHWATPPGIWRTLGALGVIGVTVGMFALWIASNRIPLAHRSDLARSSSVARVRVVFVHLPVRPWRLAPPGRVALDAGPPLALPAPAAARPGPSPADLQVSPRG